MGESFMPGTEVVFKHNGRKGTVQTVTFDATNGCTVKVAMGPRDTLYADPEHLMLASDWRFLLMGEPRFKYVVDEPPPDASHQVVGCCKKCGGAGGWPDTCKACGGTGLSGFATMLHPPGENELLAALDALLIRDERRTCQHEDTHRGGVLWEICDQCGAKWADDDGGRPAWKDPPEWGIARTLIAKHRSQG